MCVAPIQLVYAHSWDTDGLLTQWLGGLLQILASPACSETAISRCPVYIQRSILRRNLASKNATVSSVHMPQMWNNLCACASSYTLYRAHVYCVSVARLQAMHYRNVVSRICGREKVRMRVVNVKSRGRSPRYKSRHSATFARFVQFL